MSTLGLQIDPQPPRKVVVTEIKISGREVPVQPDENGFYSLLQHRKYRINKMLVVMLEPYRGLIP